MTVISTHTLASNEGGMAVYNAMDSMMTYEIHEALTSLGHNDNLIYDFERALQAPALEMMRRGFRVDITEHDRTVAETKTKLDRTSFILDLLARAVWEKGVNPNSGMQLRDLFYNHMHLPVIETSVRGERKVPMDRKVLERLQAYYHARPIVHSVLLWRDLAKQLQVLETDVDKDWRWRCSYNIAGTDTGRFSSSKSVTGTGNNFQNIEDSLRRIFIADDGWKLCGIDLEQAESREVGWLCGILFNDWTYLDACESGDLHTTVARMCWPELDWTGDIKRDKQIANQPFYRHHTRRDTTKRLSHGSNYYGKPFTMANHTQIPVDIVKRFQEHYFDNFPAIPRFHRWVATEIQTKGFLTNVFGRRRDFFDRTSSDETLRSAIAFLPQSATADRLNIILWRVWKFMGCRIQLLAQLHDALYFQFRDDPLEEREVVGDAIYLAENPPMRQGREFTVPAEAVVGYNWAHRFRVGDDGRREDWNKRGLCSLEDDKDRR
jgi:DNA polymerase-1